MRFDLMLIGLAFFTFFIVGGAMIFADLDDSYELNLDDRVWQGASTGSNESVYDVISDLEDDIVEPSKGKVFDDNTELTDEDAENILFSGGFGVLKFISSSFKLVDLIFNSIAQEIGLDSKFVGIFFLVFVISVIFTVVYLVFRFKP